jgi:hypothetical protein
MPISMKIIADPPNTITATYSRVPDKVLLRNAAQCAKCGDVIESTYRHDWVQCSCKAIFIDGGLTYIRWGGDPDDFIDMSEWG